MKFRPLPLLLILIALAGCGSAAPSANTLSTSAPTTAAEIPAPTATVAASATTAPTAAPSATVAASATAAPTEAATAQPTVAATAEPTIAPSATAPLADDQGHDTASLNDSAAPVPTPAPAEPVASASEPASIEIDQIDLDRKLMSVGLDKNRVPIVPKHDIAWYNLSAKPGQGENVVMWGHVLRFKNAPNIPAPFARLKEVPVGARITVQTADGTKHNYIVSEKVYAKPEQVEYILPTGSERLTLVSCIGDKVVVDGSVEMTHRLITIAVPE